MGAYSKGTLFPYDLREDFCEEKEWKKNKKKETNKTMSDCSFHLRR